MESRLQVPVRCRRASKMRRSSIFLELTALSGATPICLSLPADFPGVVIDGVPRLPGAPRFPCQRIARVPPARGFEVLRPHLKKMEIVGGTVLVEASETMEHVYLTPRQHYLAGRSEALSLTLADSGGVSESIFHALPNMVRNFYTVSAWPGHERNLMVPDFTADRCDRVAEGQDRFRIPCGSSGLELSRFIEIVCPECYD